MKWRSRQSASEVERILPDVVSKATVDGGKLNYAFEDYSVIQTGFSVIAAALEPNTNVPDHACESFVSDAIRDLISSGAKPTAEVLLRAATDAERSYLKRKPDTYVLLSRLSIKLPSTRHRRLTWKGTEFRFSTIRPRRYERPISAVHLEEKQSQVANYCWVRTPVSARDEIAAGNIASEALDEWRAIWNYTLNYGKRRISFGGGHPDPVNVVVSGPVHTLHHSDGSPATSTHWWEPAHLDGIRTTPIEPELDRVARLLRKYQRNLSTSAAGSSISKLLVRYARALDERDMQSGFLKLWGVLEVATNTTFQSYELTVKRAASVWRDKNRAKVVLQHLRNRRNDLVHQGRDPTNPQEIVYILKPYVDELLGRLIGNAPNFLSLEEFGHYLDLLRNPAALDRQARLLRLARRAR